MYRIKGSDYLSGDRVMPLWRVKRIYSHDHVCGVPSYADLYNVHIKRTAFFRYSAAAAAASRALTMLQVLGTRDTRPTMRTAV